MPPPDRSRRVPRRPPRRGLKMVEPYTLSVIAVEVLKAAAGGVASG